MQLCSVLCGSLDGRGFWARMDTCLYMADSICCSSETITTLLISYNPIQNKKFKKQKEPKKKKNALLKNTNHHLTLQGCHKSSTCQKAQCLQSTSKRSTIKESMPVYSSRRRPFKTDYYYKTSSKG